MDIQRVGWFGHPRYPWPKKKTKTNWLVCNNWSAEVGPNEIVPFLYMPIVSTRVGERGEKDRNAMQRTKSILTKSIKSHYQLPLSISVLWSQKKLDIYSTRPQWLIFCCPSCHHHKISIQYFSLGVVMIFFLFLNIIFFNYKSYF